MEGQPGRTTRAIAALLFLVAALAVADEVLVLKDGRRIAVTRLVRRDGMVLFETTRGERFAVPEADVVSPPLASIPLASPPPTGGPQVLVLKDGRRIRVNRLVRRGNEVRLETTSGERFAVPLDQVVSPALDTIPLAEVLPDPLPPPPLPPSPAPSPAEPVAPPPPVPSPAPPVARPGLTLPLPDLEPLGFAGGRTVKGETPPDDEFIPMPDRWRLGFPRYERYRPSLGMPWVEGSPFDPYNQNLLKGDYPIAGDDVFLNLNLQSNSNLNPRQVAAGEAKEQLFYNQNLVLGAEVFKGDTVFQPKDLAVRATLVVNLNFLANDSLSLGDLEKGQGQQGLEEAFVEKRLAVLGPNFDFVSLRAGMQNFTSDFRGYVFTDNQLGVRLFGNARSNRHQYNLAWFSVRRREEVSQLHDLSSRGQNVFIANWFVQDAFTPGYTLLFNVHLNRDGGFEPGEDEDLTPDPGRLAVMYLGVHGDGRWGDWNVSHAFYQVTGSDDSSGLAGQAVDVSARMAALEVSRDVDWRRYRATLFYASGDDTRGDVKATGFDMITDNPNLAGGAFMFWTQQASRVMGLPDGRPLSDKFSLLPNLRSKFNNKANFVNPGLLLLNAGLDVRVSPRLKVVTNASWLRFASTGVLEELLDRESVGKNIGLDLGLGFKWRPLLNENLFLVGGLAALRPVGGFKDLLAEDGSLFSAFLNLQMAY